MGVPHLVTEDDTFQGYTIPKGTTVIACAYSIHLRSEDYDSPEEFRPERFLNNPYGTKYKVTEDTTDTEGRKTTYAFGAGRRMCPGDQFATNALLIAAAKLLWAFEVSYDGTPDVSWETGYGSGLTSPPINFRTRFAARSEQRKKAVIQKYERSEQWLNEVLG
jgi:cytochrome P450